MDAASGLVVGDQVVEHVFRRQFGYPCRRVRCRGGPDGVTGSQQHCGYPCDAEAVGDYIGPQLQ